jgi:Flp pilus assembly protein TadG
MRNRAPAQAVVEFGLVAMLFFMLLFGIFDFGMLLNDWVGATSAASVGARQAAVGACLEGPVSDPATCATGETSVIGAVMESAPLLATGANCQNRPQALGASNRCASRVDIALVDLSIQGASCRDAELWVSSQTAQSGSTSTVIRTSGTTWGSNALVGKWLTFTSGTDAGASEAITANTATTITVAPAFPKTPGIGDTFDLTPATLTLVPMTSGFSGVSCSAAMANPQINDALKVVVRTWVDLPVPLPGLTDMYAESSSTVRYEGAYVQ